MKGISRRRGKSAVYTVTDAQRPMSEDIGYRERRYLLTMGVRALCFLLSILLAFTLPGSLRWLALVAALGAVVLPYVAVIFANGGREPDSSARFQPYEPQEPESSVRKQISGRRHQIGS